MSLKKIQKRNKDWSSYTCFAEWARGKKLEKGKLRRAFFRDVDKGDYLPSEADLIIESLIELTNGKPYPV